MNPGAAEEGAKAAVGFMDALRSQPLSLALVVMNFALLGYMAWQNHEFVTQRQKVAEKLIERDQEQSRLLANCVPIRDMQDLLKGLGIERSEDKKP